MTSSIHLKSLRNLKLDNIYNEIEKQVVGWHKKRKCSCLKDLNILEINNYTIKYCKHVKEDIWNKKKKKINQIYNLSKTIWRIKTERFS